MQISNQRKRFINTVNAELWLNWVIPEGKSLECEWLKGQFYTRGLY